MSTGTIECSQSRIANLASIIARNTAEIDGFLRSRDLPFPSFDIDAPLDFHLSKELNSARNLVVDASIELKQLLLGPKELLLSNVPNHLISLHAIYHFKLATAIPIGGEATFEQISERCGLNEIDLRRLLRHAMTNRIFSEVREGVVVHTAVSKILAEDAKMLAWTGVCVEEMWPSAVKTVPAMAKWPNSQEPVHTGFSLANNTEESMYAILGKDPQRAERFGVGMSALITSEGYELHHIVDSIPWASFGSGTVVDLGGSHGDAMIAVAKHFTTLRFIVQDLPQVIDSRPPLPSELDGLISFMSHDFFTPQPVKGAKVYFFRWIFHNWSDAYCLSVLQNLVTALEPGAQLIINDICLPEPGTVPSRQESKIRTLDVAMLQIQNSRERGEQDWKRLLKQADERFRFQRVMKPAGSILAIIQAVWDCDPLQLK